VAAGDTNAMMARPTARIEQIYSRKTVPLVGLFVVVLLLLPTIVTASSTTTTTPSSKRPGWRLPTMSLGRKSTEINNVTQSSEIERKGT
jgi:hypothetical protein